MSCAGLTWECERHAQATHCFARGGRCAQHGGRCKLGTKPDARAYFGGRARLLRFSGFVDKRGRLLPLSFSLLPFLPKRSFVVSQVPAGTRRGRHGHRVGSQLLFCLHGRIEVLRRDGESEATVCLTDNSAALLIGPRIWAQQTYFTENSILLVFASEEFDPASYVDDTSELT